MTGSANRRRHLVVRNALVAAATMSAISVTTAAGAEAHRDTAVAPTLWNAAWTTAEQYPRDGFGGEANWSLSGFDNHSLRQVIRLSDGGSQLRIRLSNRFGDAPLHVRGATVGRTRSGATLRPGTIRPIRFDGHLGETIPMGTEVVSDPVEMVTRPLESLTVTLYIDRPSGAATFHDAAFTTSYRAVGDRRFEPRARGFTETSHSWYYLTGVHVRDENSSSDTVIALGDSLTDGYGTQAHLNNRYPDELSELLVARGTPRPVVNLGINGNKFLVDSPCFGERGLDRLRSQVLTQPGASTLVVELGLNDIGSAGRPVGSCGANPVITAEDLIAAHKQVAHLARQHGLYVIGATMSPMKGSGYYSKHNERLRDRVNEWIRSTDVYDAVVDFDHVLADSADPDAFDPRYSYGDGLHPNDAGRHEMAEAVLPLLD